MDINNFIKNQMDNEFTKLAGDPNMSGMQSKVMSARNEFKEYRIWKSL